ncbi:nucleoside diphosphate kinase [Holotrichia oblita]|nr:nucleoside diphosphate kinase [Holotrichia oblita]
MEEKTYIMIKPDGFEDTAIVKGYIRRAGYQIVAQKKMRLTEAILREHYDFLVDKPFFGDIVEFMTSGPVICMIVEGENAVAGMRTLMGATDPNEAAEGTIRKALAKSKQRNIIHGADSPENAEKEIKRFFPELAAEKRRVYTIKVMDEQISDAYAEFIDIRPAEKCEYRRCVENVAKHIERNGGSAIFGWEFIRAGNMYLTANAHVIWLSPNGEKIDITPKPRNRRTKKVWIVIIITQKKNPTKSEQTPLVGFFYLTS